MFECSRQVEHQRNRSKSRGCCSSVELPLPPQPATAFLFVTVPIESKHRGRLQGPGLTLTRPTSGPIPTNDSLESPVASVTECPSHLNFIAGHPDLVQLSLDFADACARFGCQPISRPTQSPPPLPNTLHSSLPTRNHRCRLDRRPVLCCICFRTPFGNATASSRVSPVNARPLNHPTSGPESSASRSTRFPLNNFQTRSCCLPPPHRNLPPLLPLHQRVGACANTVIDIVSSHDPVIRLH